MTFLDLFFMLAVTVSTPAPTPTAATPTAPSTATNNCYCQTIPLKDWGK